MILDLRFMISNFIKGFTIRELNVFGDEEYDIGFSKFGLSGSWLQR